MDAGLERIKQLEKQFARAPINSRQRRELTAEIRIEAGAYRRSLDIEQAAATRDPKPQMVVGSGSLNRASALGKPTPVHRRAIPRRSRTPRR
jgi:hypothetical protein